MKSKFVSTLFSVLLAIAFCCVMPFFAFATSPSESNNNNFSFFNSNIATCDNNYPYTSFTNALAINNKEWKAIDTSSTGFNCKVYIQCRNTKFMSNMSVAYGSIRMLDKDGNILWEEEKAVPGQGSRVFKCGKDVYTILIKTQAGNGLAYATQK